VLARHGVDGIGVNEGTERATVDDEPGDEGSELCGREDVDLEHGDRVRPDRLIPEFVDAQLGDWGVVRYAVSYRYLGIRSFSE
jgi:hypothetical protein